MRVLMVTPRYLPYIGGVENHVHQVSRRLAEAGVDVTVLATDPEGKLPAEEQSQGVRVRRVRAWPARRDYYFAPGIFRVVGQGGWDLVHCQSYHTLVPPAAMLAARRAGIPYVVTFHGGGHSSRLRNSLRRAQHWLLRPLFAGAERLIATASFEIGYFGERLGLPPERFALIPNGSDLSLTTGLARSDRNGALIASVGRLERYKGHHRLIAALPHILREKPEARLWIAGEGPYEASLQRMARRLGLEERVEIRAIPMGEVQRRAAELSRAALVALLSEYETHPMAALEALSLGCPLLVADTSGLSELAARGWARAIPLASSPQQVAEAALEQLRRPLLPERLELPSWDECARSLMELYEDCLRSPRCAS